MSKKQKICGSKLDTFEKRSLNPQTGLLKVRKTSKCFWKENITNQKTFNFDDGHYKKLVNTNYIKFLNHKYDNHIFYPHTDHGKTALVYLNKAKSKGTNFYHPINYEQGDEHEEHFITPDQVEILHHIDSEYNKLIIWEGKDLWHGLCMDPKYTDEWRVNQPFFFQQ